MDSSVDVRRTVPDALRPRTLLALAVVVTGLGCGPRPPVSVGPEGSSAGSGGAGARAQSGPVARPGHPLSRADAQGYGLALINRDRAAAGLAPVTLDTVASAAAQRHVRDLVAAGATAHWGTDGSVPELRYTQAGGEDLTTENAACFGDARPRSVDEKGPFEPAAIERFQSAFLAEVPPSDGHRRNILDPMHNKVGLGYATSPGSEIVCVVQEFIDDYGSYGPLPAKAKAGDTLNVRGEVRAPVTFGGIGLSRVPLPEPRTPKQLLATGGYQMPNPFVSYFPKGFKTPKPVDVDGNRFSLALPLVDLQGPGIYEVIVFVRTPGGGKTLSPVSLRTVVVE